ncbi:MAG TPA: alginate lyase family protein [Blastocatellia bacterium]|nr:alginate lyase family protein [Blastocatellia bacterium]
MASRITLLKRLRGKGLREIAGRSRQEFAKLNERVLGASSAELSDTQLLGQIDPASRNGKGEGSVRLIIDRIRSSTVTPNHSSIPLPFFSSLSNREKMCEIIKQGFPADRQALLDSAESAIAGRFDLLGLNDLSFGDPIDWHLDPTTGKRAPLVHWSKIDYLDSNIAGDKKVIWELNRHAHFVTLGQAYWLTGDERFAEAFITQASAWMDSNPPKLGINWASSLELSFRVIAWIWALHLFSDSDRLNSGFTSRFFKYLIAQGRHIESYLSRYFSPNTHLTGEALGLFYLGAALPELGRARRWRDLGLKILLEQLPIHIRPDGTYFEQSSYYHRYTADFYTHLIALARSARIELPDEVEARLSLALNHLMWITRPDGTTPLYGDDDGGRLIKLASRAPADFRDTLATGAALFGRSDWKHVAGEASIETLWLLGPDGLSRNNQVASREPVETSRAFTDGGFFVMRDGWSRQSSFALIDCGPHGTAGCGHAHADSLAFEFAANGKTWLVDPGTFTYTGDAKLRDEFRATEAHNTVTVDGQPQSIPAGPFAWKQVARSHAREFITDKAFDYFEGSHDGYMRLDDPVSHSRSILFVKQADDSALPPMLIVRDVFDACDDHRYALRYHTAPGSVASVSNNQFNATDTSGNDLLIRAFGSRELKPQIEDGWVSRCYGQREPAPAALFEAEGKGPQECVSFFIPTCTGGPPWPSLVEETAPAERGAASEGRPYKLYSIQHGDASDVVMFGAASRELSSDALPAAGSLAWARFAGDKFTRGCLILGNTFEVADTLGIQSPDPMKYCAVELVSDRLDITIHDTRRFDLSFSTPLKKIVINKIAFDVTEGSCAARFALDGSNWTLVSAD